MLLKDTTEFIYALHIGVWQCDALTERTLCG